MLPPDPSLMSNPFAALPIIAAPAILTNAASVLAMSTSNRFLRASERMRALALRLDVPDQKTGVRELLAKQVVRVEQQALLLLNGLGASYLALGSFASASLISIVGAAMDAGGWHAAAHATVILALLTGFCGAASLVHSCYNLFRATRLAMLNITEEAGLIRGRHSSQVHHDQPGGPEIADEP